MIAEIGTGISVSQNRRVENPVSLPYLRVANVLRGYLDLSDVRTIRVEKDRVTAYLLQVGDILFTEGGDRDKLGRGWITATPHRGPVNGTIISVNESLGIEGAIFENPGGCTANVLGE
jgi:hypothetical protein